MKKSLFLVDEYPRITSTGGQGDWSRIITGIMKDLGFEVHVITGPKGKDREENFVHVQRMPQRDYNDLFKILQAVKASKPDLIFTAAIYPPYYFSSWLHPKAAKVLVSHGPPLMKDQPLTTKTNRLAHWMWPFVATRYNRIICTTLFELSLYKKRLTRMGMKELAKNKLRQVSFPINVDFFSEKQNRKKLHKKWGLEDAEFIVSEIAVFLHEHKDQLTAARAVQYLVDKGLKAKLVLTGIDPTPDQSYKKQILDAIDERNVVFTGGLDKEKLREAYWIADAYVSPGYDTQGLSPREAMATFRPLFLADIVFLQSGFKDFATYHRRYDWKQLGEQLYQCFKKSPKINEKEVKKELEKFSITHYRENMKEAFVESLEEKRKIL